MSATKLDSGSGKEPGAKIRIARRKSPLRRIAIILGIVTLLAVSWFSGYLPVLIVVMYESITPIVPPERPAKVPATAIWAGHRDGGVFIECLIAAETNHCFDCVVYFDYSGDIWMREIFCPNEGTITIDSLRKVFGGYNGYWISLEDGRQLVPMVNRDMMSAQEKEWYFDQVDSGWHMESFNLRRFEQETTDRKLDK